jgi:hypothetical protein
MGSLLRIKLRGRAAHLGEVPAADVAHLLLGIEGAIARAADRRAGRIARRGRHKGVVEETTRLRLEAIRRGTVSVVTRLPDVSDDDPDGESFGFEVAHLGEQATQDVLTLIDEGGEDVDPILAAEVAAVLGSTSERLGIGTRYECIDFAYGARTFRRPIRLDLAARERLSTLALPREPIPSDHLIGTLVEADFERHSARLRSPDGAEVKVSFEDPLADEIYAALREPAQLGGEVTYNRHTGAATRVQVRHIERATQLMMGSDEIDFWSDPTIRDLAAEQRVTPIDDLNELHDDDASEEEIEAIFEALRA